MRPVRSAPHVPTRDEESPGERDPAACSRPAGDPARDPGAGARPAGPQPGQARAAARSHPARREGRGGRDLLLRHEAPQGVLDAPPEGRDLGRHRPGDARGDPELRAGRAAHGPRPRGRGTDRGDRGGRDAALGRRAGARPDRLPAPADPGGERGLRLQLRGRAPGVRPPRRAGDHRARDGRALPHPRRRDAERLRGRPAGAVGMRRGFVRVPRARGARSWRPPARRGGRGPCGRRPGAAAGRERARRRDGSRRGRRATGGGPGRGRPRPSGARLRRRYVRAGRPVLRRHRLLRRRRRSHRAAPGTAGPAGRARPRAGRDPDRAGRGGRRRQDPLRPHALGRHAGHRRPSTVTRSHRPTASSGPATGSR